jgi:hypothetical protein
VTTPRSVYCVEKDCALFRGSLGPTFDPTFICIAYPFGIPEEVLSGEDAHLSSRGDDDGYIYTPNGVQPMVCN